MPDLITLSGHTEGPWCAYQNREHECWGVYDGGDNVCDLYYLAEDTHRHHNYENDEANARLIAAAPDLLAIATSQASLLHALGHGEKSDRLFESCGLAPPATEGAEG